MSVDSMINLLTSLVTLVAAVVPIVANRQRQAKAEQQAAPQAASRKSRAWRWVPLIFCLSGGVLPYLGMPTAAAAMFFVFALTQGIVFVVAADGSPTRFEIAALATSFFLSAIAIVFLLVLPLHTAQSDQIGRLIGAMEKMLGVITPQSGVGK